jgi:hypothetical protein
LPPVERDVFYLFPEARRFEDLPERFLRSIDGAAEAADKPLHPRCYVEGSFLCLFEDAVVGVAFLADLRRHAVKALGAILGSSQAEIGDRARDAAIAVVEGVDGDKPEMGKAGLQHGIHRGLAFEPVQE